MNLAIGLIVALVVVAVVLVFSGSCSSSAEAPSDASMLEGTPERAANLPIAQASSDRNVDEGVVMTLGGSADTYVLVGEEYLEAGCRAIDPDAAGSPDITSTIQIDGTVDTATPGDHTITYTATTENDEVTTAERRVHVVDSFDGGKAASIPVFMYHYVYDPAAPPDNLDANWISTTNLEAHLKYLAENDYYYPSYQEIHAFAEGTHSLPAKCATLTFDDGEYGVLSLGRALFEKYEVPATSFVIGNNPDIMSVIRSNVGPYLLYQSHTNMHEGGSGIGKGGIIHAMSYDEILENIQATAELIGTNDAVAYPFGDYNDTAEAAIADAGVQCAFTTENRRVRPGDSPMALPRVRIQGSTDRDTFAALVAADPA